MSREYPAVYREHTNGKEIAASLLSVSEFTVCKQAKALVERFGDYDLEAMRLEDEGALLAILAILPYREFVGLSVNIEDAAEQIFADPDLDKTSEDMPEIIELVEGITVEDALLLMQFMMQEAED